MPSIPSQQTSATHQLTLRPYQSRAVEAVRRQWASGVRSVCLVLPTGGGKTVTATELCSPFARVLWIAHRRELIEQAAESLRRGRWGRSRVGLIAPRHTYVPAAPIQVATVQTLLARSRQRPSADLVVWDECHHERAESYSRITAAYPDALQLGLTATPERSDGKPLGDGFSGLVVGATYSELLEDGHLVPCRVYQPPESIGKRALAQDPLDAYQRYTAGQSAFVFVASVALARETARRFTGAGVPAAVVECHTPPDERVRALRAFADGSVRVLVNVATLTEGVDIPRASACILARGCSHVGLYLQIAGRILRPAPGKSEATLVDLTGASLTHGLPTADRAYSLSGDGICSASVASLRNCLQCGAVFPSRPGPCPICGYDPPRREPPPPRIYSLELREVFAGPATPQEAKRREHDRLRALARERGWAPYWVVREYRKLFGEDPVLDDATEDERMAELRSLVRIQRERGHKPGFVGVRYRAMFERYPSAEMLARATAQEVQT